MQANAPCRLYDNDIDSDNRIIMLSKFIAAATAADDDYDCINLKPIGARGKKRLGPLL